MGFRARVSGVYAISIGFVICALGFAFKSSGKEGRERESVTPVKSTKVYSAVASTPVEFQWKEHNKLSWSDFQGPVRADNDESAAATHCGIGFRMNKPDANGKPQVTVYNTFYVNKSWVRPDAKISSILDHEQGHFDLCEIYTRKLRQRIEDFNFNIPQSDIRQALYNIFTKVNEEYENRQQAYEQETTHGVNLDQQHRWQANIGNELSVL